MSAPSPLLRSVIDVDGGLTQENLIANFQTLQATPIEWLQPEDERLLGFLTSFFQQRLELPSGQTCLDHFEARKDVETVERIKDLLVAKPYI